MENAPEVPPTPPADPRHLRFALLVAAYESLAESYQKAGFKCSRATAYVNGHRLSRKPDVAQYIATMRHLEYEERRHAYKESCRACDALVAANREAGFQAMLGRTSR